MFNTVQSLDEKNTALIYKMVLALPPAERWKSLGLQMLLATNKNCLHKDDSHGAERGPSEVIVHWLPLPGSTKRKNQRRPLETERVYECACVCERSPGAVMSAPSRTAVTPVGSDAPASVLAGRWAHGWRQSTWKHRIKNDSWLIISDQKLILIFIIIYYYDHVFFFTMVNCDLLTE